MCLLIVLLFKNRETDVRKSLIWARPKLIYTTNGKNTDLKRHNSFHFIFVHFNSFFIFVIFSKENIYTYYNKMVSFLLYSLFFYHHDYK